MRCVTRWKGDYYATPSAQPARTLIRLRPARLGWEAQSRSARRRRVRVRDSERIAIVGMAGRFPGARSVDALWGRARRRDGVEDTFVRGGHRRRRTGAESGRPQPVTWTRRLRTLDPSTRLLRHRPRDAAIMDPQHRQFLECAEALEEAARASPVPRRDRGLRRFGNERVPAE